MTGGSSLIGNDPPPPVAADLALLLDFDGTLVELAPRPDDVRLGERAREALGDAAAAMPGRVAVVSGRSLDVLVALLGDGLATRIALAGSHGVEERPADGTAVAVPPPPSLAAAAAELAAFADRHGIVFEGKTLGAALHYRARPELGAAATAHAAAAARRHDLVFQPGKMMAEVRVAGDKGGAVRRLMATAAMRGARPLMVGDDVTDEAGFVAAAALGGAGVLVGERRETAAAYRLPDVAAVIAWIEAVAKAAAAAEAPAGGRGESR